MRATSIMTPGPSPTALHSPCLCWRYGVAVSRRLLSPGQLRFVRVASVSVLGMLLFGVVIAMATYPSWQLLVATVCVAAPIPIMWIGLGRQLAPLNAGTSARAYLLSAVPAVAALALLAAAGWMFALAPIT